MLGTDYDFIGFVVLAMLCMFIAMAKRLSQSEFEHASSERYLLATLIFFVLARLARLEQLSQLLQQGSCS